MIHPLTDRLPGRETLFQRLGKLSFPLIFVLAFSAISLAHWTLLHLPYFWDEGGYYVPAALDFYRSGSFIPAFTNAHPPLPNVVLALFWYVFGLHIVVTRLVACAFAAGAITAVFFLGKQLLQDTAAAITLAVLTALYPIWFAQSSLAHADIFAAAFTLAALALYFSSPALIGNDFRSFSSNRSLFWTSALFCLSVLAKETAVVQPAALAAVELMAAYRSRTRRTEQSLHLRWAAALLTPIPVLASWYAYHFVKTGFIFGNPAFFRYNATANFTVAHVFYALRIRFVHLFWQRNIWLPLSLAAACLLLPPRSPVCGQSRVFGLPRPVVTRVAILLLANLLAFSVLGGALLTRYLLPAYSLLLLLSLAVWRDRTALWPAFAILTGLAFFSALWLNPSTFFAPEDNLTYRDMIVVQQQAINLLNRRYPDATVLTAWPVSADLFRPELGYTNHTYHVVSIENFTPPELLKAARQADRFDTALLFTTHYTSPAFRRYLVTHPRSWQGRHYGVDLDLTPAQIAGILGGRVVWQANRRGEWAAILRFDRSYDARVTPPTPKRSAPEVLSSPAYASALR